MDFVFDTDHPMYVIVNVDGTYVAETNDGETVTVKLKDGQRYYLPDKWKSFRRESVDLSTELNLDVALKCSDMTLTKGVSIRYHGREWNKLDIGHVSVDYNSHDLLYSTSPRDSLKVIFPANGKYYVLLKGLFSVEKLMLNIIINGRLELGRNIEAAYYNHSVKHRASFEHMFNNYYIPFEKGDVLEYIARSTEDFILSDCVLKVIRYKEGVIHGKNSNE